MTVHDIAGAAAPVDALTRAGVTSHGRRALVVHGTLVHHGRGLYSHALTPDVDAAVRAWGTRGGVGFARTMAAFVDGRRESPLETRAAWEAYLAGVTLVPQVVIRDEHGGWVARGDFVVDGRNVLVEVDGIGKYRRHADFKNERVRHNQIEELGWIVVRVTDECLRFGRFIPRLRDAVARSRVRITP